MILKTGGGVREGRAPQTTTRTPEMSAADRACDIQRQLSESGPVKIDQTTRGKVWLQDRVEHFFRAQH
jgi:hypothetical protein